MTDLMKRAWEEASRLKDADQDAIAALVLEEIASEARWDRQFAESRALLESLADEATSEFQRGKTQPLDPEAL